MNKLINKIILETKQLKGYMVNNGKDFPENLTLIQETIMWIISMPALILVCYAMLRLNPKLFIPLISAIHNFGN